MQGTFGVDALSEDKLLTTGLVVKKNKLGLDVAIMERGAFL